MRSRGTDGRVDKQRVIIEGDIGHALLDGVIFDFVAHRVGRPLNKMRAQKIRGAIRAMIRAADGGDKAD